MHGYDSFFGDQTTPGMTPQTSLYPNPNYQGARIVDRDDLFPCGFTKVELDAVYAGLTQDVHDEGLILESPVLAEVEFYNPGIEPVSDDFILEAITVEHFSRTERRMAAVVKVLNRHLKESEITALPPVVGKPRKSGTYAYVIVQLPFSDGQTVNVIFHSPEGDKKKITASDTIIAFRWLLNKRDITHVVAPEDGEEVSLETIAKRVTQLVVKNSARFERQQKTAQAERRELDTTREAVKEAEDRQTELMDKVAGVAKEAESVEARLSNTLAQLEKQRTINAELQAKIDALRAQRGQTGTGSTSTEDPFVETLRIQNEILSLSPEETAALRHYSQGKDEGYGSRMPVSFIIKDKSDLFFYQLKSQPTPQAKYNFLQKQVQSGNIGAPKINNGGRFSDAMDVQRALREGKSFTFFELAPRKGYVLATLVIDLDGKQTGSVSAPAYTRDLQDIIDGKYDTDTGRILDLLEKAIEAAEKDGSLEDHYLLLDAASNRLTDLLAKEAA